MDIWSVSNKDPKQLRLWRMDQDNFRVIEEGNYLELIMANKIDLQTIDHIVAKGKNVWTCNGHLFVSGELKKELENIGGELEFSLGFSKFAAM